MKRRMVNAVLMTVLAASMVMCGCGNKAQEAPETAMEARAAEPEEKEDEYSEEDLEGIVTGLEDHYIMEKAEDIDYLHNVQYDEDIVVGIKENGAKEVDAAKTGKYTVTYTVTADKEALADYIEKKAEEAEKKEASDEAGPDEKDDADRETDRAETEKKPVAEEEGVKDTEAKEEASDKSGTDEKNTDQDAEKEPEESGVPEEKEEGASGAEDKETVEIEVKKDMTVVDEEKAKDLADKGEVVWTDKNETVSKSDGSEVKEEAEAPASTEDKGTASTPAKTEKPASGNTGNGSGTKPAQQAHTHNYNIPVTTVRHHDAVTQQVWVQDSAAWDEPVYGNRTICTTCGADLTGTDYAWHDCGTWTVKQVQTGTIHHDATGHYENRVVQNAWDETVTTGYKCSCGAVQ